MNGVGQKHGNKLRSPAKTRRKTFKVVEERASTIPPTPQPPFFDFKTKAEGEVTFSITQTTGQTAMWYMGDGTIYANTNEVTHIYADGSEKTVSVAVGDTYDNVTNVDGISKLAGAVSAVYFAPLLQIPIKFEGWVNQFEEIVLPAQVNNLSIQNNVYPSAVNCVFFIPNEVINTVISNNGSLPIFDLSGVDLSTSFISGNTAGGKLILPSNNRPFTLIRVSGFQNQGPTDFSGLTGPIDRFDVLSVRNMPSLIPPNLDACTYLYIKTCYELETTVLLDNGAGNCTYTRFYRNNNSALRALFFDLTNFRFSQTFIADGFSTQGPARGVILPALNDQDFIFFKLNTLPEQGDIDLSGFSGVFSGELNLGGIGGITNLIFPPDIQNVSTISVGSTQFNSTCVIDNNGGNCTNLLINRCGNPFGSNAVFDMANFTGSVSFRVLGFSSTRSCKQVIFPVANSGAYSTFTVEYIHEQGVMDLSGFTGVFTGNFFIRSIYNSTVITLPSNLTGLTNFTITNCTEWSDSIDLGTQVIATNIDLSSNALLTADIDSMVAKINTNVANFPAGAKSVNFGNSSNLTNQSPSTASITTMSALAASDNFTFTYWDGSQNVTITP